MFREAKTITPSDSSDIDQSTTGYVNEPWEYIYIGTAGDVKIDDFEGNTGVIFKNLESGYILPIQAKKIYATDTTASNIVVMR